MGEFIFEIVFEFLFELIVEGSLDAATDRKAPVLLRFFAAALLLVFVGGILFLMGLFGLDILDKHPLAGILLLALALFLLGGILYTIHKRMKK